MAPRGRCQARRLGGLDGLARHRVLGGGGALGSDSSSEAGRASAPAYRVFGDGWADRRMLVEHDPVAAVSTWIVKPARAVFVLSRLPLVDVPVRSARKAPVVGDHLLLSDEAMTSGPWVVIRRTETPSTLHPRDEREIEDQRRRESLHGRRDVPSLTWLTIRPHVNVAGASAVSVASLTTRFSAGDLNESECAQLRSELISPLLPLTEQVTDRRTDGIRQANREIVELLQREGRPVPPNFEDEEDVFDDWN